MKLSFSLLVVTYVSAAVARSSTSEFEKAQLKNIQYPVEWHLWKAEHEKKYESPHHELSRHLVWMSNKKYIDEHNKHADTLGYGLKMNQFGDMVCESHCISTFASIVCSLNQIDDFAKQKKPAVQ